jgi:hypothetical protein
MHDAEPSTWPSNRRYVYSKTTSTTSLRPHIEKYHLEQFKQLAKEHGWKILLPGLASQARSEAIVGAQQGRPDNLNFNESTFHDCLINFIVANDQVPFYPL